MYFLPYLFLISTLYCFFQEGTNRVGVRNANIVLPSILILGAVAASLVWPTSVSTGPAYALIALYVLAFASGRLYAAIRRNKVQLGVGILLTFSAAAISRVDPRYSDVAAAVGLFLIFFYASRVLPNLRLPGSGGAYLLHAPVANHGLSTTLFALGITAFSNLYISILATYSLCIMVTYLVIKYMPRYRWIMLE